MNEQKLSPNMENKYQSIKSEIIIKEFEIFKKFNNIRLTTTEEKELYLKIRFLNNSKKQNAYNFFSKIISILLVLYGFYSAYDILISYSIYMSSILFILIINLMTLGFGYILYNSSNSSKKQLKMIENGNLYIADAYSYAHKKEPRGGDFVIYDYYVKITDKKGHYIDNWFLVPKITYFDDSPKLIRTTEIIPDISTSEHKEIGGKLYIANYNDKYIVDFITEDELNEKTKFFFLK